MNDDIKNFTHNPGAGKRTSRGHLWSVATGDQLEEPVTVDVAPDSMGGQDSAAMLRVDGDPNGVETPGSEAINGGVGHIGEGKPGVAHPRALDGRPNGGEDLEDYELRYADGSSTPPKPVRRHLFRPGKNRVPADHELEAAVAETTTDVWAAHRNDPVEGDAEPAWDQPTEMLTASKDQDRRRGRRPLALIAVGAVVVAALAGASIVALGGGGGNTQASRVGTANRAKVHHKTLGPTSHVVTVTLPATVTSTTLAKSTGRAKHKTRKRTVSHSTVATSTVASTPVVSSPPAVTSTPAVTDTPKVTTSSSTRPTTSTPASSKSSTTRSSSSTSGGLPDVQQTEQQP